MYRWHELIRDPFTKSRYDELFREIPFCLHDFFMYEFPQETARNIWEDIMAILYQDADPNNLM